jgi:hypothetical protein
MDSSEHTPGVGTEGIFQFKFPVAVVYSGSAEKDTGFHTHMGNLPNGDDFLYIDSQQLPLLIFQL